MEKWYKVMDRRGFLKKTVLSAGAWAAGQKLGDLFEAEALAGEPNQPAARPGKLPRRAYGKAGVELSIVGFGGIVVTNAEQEHAKRVVAEAVERGINYFDVAPAYGNAEEKLGPALAP